ncbi:hypothetical protein LWI29_004115 [Acer saccharum]|uniref:Uncharacterized protein n=1 Tax=Acer saccharum TaxID=4024 RepID=A0AA39W0T2_ACESA|nr:hypothetical protein LWI29_004115 [Acer saccharum]
MNMRCAQEQFIPKQISNSSLNHFVVRVKYVEQELAKKKGKNIDMTDQVENELKRAEDELYTILEHLKDNGAGPKGPTDNSSDAAGNRQAATDQFMLERFHKRERNRGMQRYLVYAKIYEKRSFPKGITVQQISENRWVAVSLVGL